MATLALYKSLLIYAVVIDLSMVVPGWADYKNQSKFRHPSSQQWNMRPLLPNTLACLWFVVLRRFFWGSHKKVPMAQGCTLCLHAGNDAVALNSIGRCQPWPLQAPLLTCVANATSSLGGTFANANAKHN